jgi:hypothetical protein
VEEEDAKDVDPEVSTTTTRSPKTVTMKARDDRPASTGDPAAQRLDPSTSLEIGWAGPAVEGSTPDQEGGRDEGTGGRGTILTNIFRPVARCPFRLFRARGETVHKNPEHEQKQSQDLWLHV